MQVYNIIEGFGTHVTLLCGIVSLPSNLFTSLPFRFCLIGFDNVLSQFGRFYLDLENSKYLTWRIKYGGWAKIWRHRRTLKTWHEIALKIKMLIRNILWQRFILAYEIWNNWANSVGKPWHEIDLSNILVFRDRCRKEETYFVTCRW